MATDNARAVPQPVLEPAGRDVPRLPTPRQPVLESAAPDIARPAPRPRNEPAAREISRPAHGSRAGWIVLTVVAGAASWAAGWVAGVSWAWREMTPGYLRRGHRRRGASLPGV